MACSVIIRSRHPPLEFEANEQSRDHYPYEQFHQQLEKLQSKALGAERLALVCSYFLYSSMACSRYVKFAATDMRPGTCSIPRTPAGDTVLNERALLAPALPDHSAPITSCLYLFYSHPTSMGTLGHTSGIISIQLSISGVYLTIIYAKDVAT